LSTRQVGVLYSGWSQGTDKSRELILNDPALFLRAQEQAMAEARTSNSAPSRLVQDLETIAATSARARRRLVQGLWLQLMKADRQAVRVALQRARAELSSIDTNRRTSGHCAGGPRGAVLGRRASAHSG
jgi:hypothetical protein